MPPRTVALLLAAACLIAGCAEASVGSSPPQVASTVSTEAWARVTAGMDAFLDQVEALDEYPPGAVVVVVTGDGRRYVRLHGETKAGSGHAVTEASAFYVASMTKAYLGLLAARLDVEGVLPLETTLADVWPRLELPGLDVLGLELPRIGRQADEVTLRDLLVHSIPFRAGEITFLEAYVRDVAPSEYPGLIERYAVARREGYDYDNLGYNIYAAALEAETGRNWRVWLAEKVFSPLGMTTTSARTSDYPTDRIAWNHQRAGASPQSWPEAGGWYLIPPKADGMMQSGGGLMTSAKDMALWLEAQLRSQGPDGSGLTAEVFARARQDRVSQPADGHGFSCGGYVYGWSVCELIVPAEEGAENEDRVVGPFLQHGGGYVGVRSLMTAAPALGLAVAFLSNSDSMTGFLGQEITKLVFELNADVSGSEARNRRRIAEYRDRNARYLTDLQDDLQQARAHERWKDWVWSPAVAELAEFVGSYERDGALLPVAAVELLDGSPFLITGDRRYRMAPAAPDLFGAQAFPYDEIVPVAFLRGAGRRIVGIDWEGRTYERLQSAARTR